MPAAHPISRSIPDFEAAAGKRSHDHKVFNAWRRFSTMPENKIARVFREIVESTVRLAGRPHRLSL